jgi:predicted metal-dependent hydrolase
MSQTGTSAHEPAGLTITPKEIQSALSPETPRYWFDNHPFKTHYFNALSSSFPVGERFFIRSVRHYEKQIADARLRQQILQFVGQEGHHRIEHRHHIDLMLAQGYSAVPRFEHMVQVLLDFLNKRFPLYSLAATVALEHFTAILADQLLRHPDRWLAPMHPDMRLLWQWHAVEETEHKAVAFDVYRQISGSYLLRITAMILETIGFLLDILVRTVYFLSKDGKLFSLRLWFEGVAFVWGRKGTLGSIVGEYFRFFRPSFHPWQNDNHHLIQQFLADYKKNQ